MTGWDARYPGTLHRHQVAALDGVAAAWATGAARCLVVLPPGAGKTVVGLTAVARRGVPAVVLSPNTAIQGQWVATWRSFEGSAAHPIGTDRDLAAAVTSLTYQSLATFDPDAEVDESGDSDTPGRHLDRLTPAARSLVDRMAQAGDLTLVLDECHHLLQVWGELLDEVLQLLPGVHVLGLTATPPTALPADQLDLTRRLFGDPVYTASIPAAVRDGRLAPYAELAWICSPTGAEREWLASQAQRFAQLRTDLTDPQFASLPFLEWLDTRVARVGAGEWPRLERDRPDLAQALLRFHHAGLVAAPVGARVREPHRQPPHADDWAVVIGGYVAEVLRPSQLPQDQAALAALRAALPAVGFHLTRAGVRRGRSPVDRVLARSDAKTRATATIIGAERRSLDEALRALVLCDHESATATLPAGLVGVLEPQAGSARAVLAELATDPALAGLGIALVTGRSVVATPAAARAIVAAAGRVGLSVEVAEGSDGCVAVTGAWQPRQWVPVVTGLFEDGVIPVLVGTRGLLGEGWDARSVTTLVDLTTATTPTAVVQARGRALRLDPDRPDKVAHTWSVTCVDHTHPRGWLDWDRFVRKHDGYLGIDESGDVVAGVAHVSARLSPYQPPPEADLDAINAAMLVRAEDRDRTRALWRVGEPYSDIVLPTLRLLPRPAPSDGTGVAVAERSPDRPPALLPALLPSGTGIAAVAGTGGRLPGGPAGGVALSVALAAALVAVLAVVGAPAVAWTLLAAPVGLAAFAGRRSGQRAVTAYRTVVGDPGIESYAAVVADALHAAGRCPQTAADVRIRVGADQVVSVDLPGPAAGAFAAALEELLAAPVLPRYVIARPQLPPLPAGSAGRRLARDAVRGRLDAPVVVHAVPAAFAVNAAGARAFTGAWQRWIALSTAQYTGSPEGAGLLAAAAGEPPVPVTSAIRTRWL